ncbi:MAG: thioredoxin [Clostridia bacterium]
MIKEITENNFKSEVVGKSGLVLVDFFATWCPPCKKLAPILEELGNSRADFDIAKVNIDDNMNIAAEYNIEVVPTLVVFKDGKVVKTSEGYMDKATILDLVDSCRD